MMNLSFTDLLLLALGALMLRVVWTDMSRRIIENRLVIAVIVGAPLFWWSIALPLWPDVPIRIGVAIAIFALGLLAFRIGQMSGGDVKLASALGLWFAPLASLYFIILMSILGAGVTLTALAVHRIKKNPGKTEVPYGVAIAGAILWLLTQRFLNQFPG